MLNRLCIGSVQNKPYSRSASRARAVLAPTVAAAVALAIGIDCAGATGAAPTNANTRGESPVAVKLNIAAQPINDALNEFARQSGLQIFFLASEETKQLISAPVEGFLEPQTALAQLLSNTGLGFKEIDKQTIAVVSAKDAATGPTADTSMLDQGELRVAQAIPPGESPSTAQTPEAEGETPDPMLEEVVVSAQKRTERLKDVPISISVLSGRELDKSTVQGVNDALNRVPGVLTSTHYQGGTQISVRGVAANGVLFRGASPISYYLDMVPFGFINSAAGPDADVYDLERIEVLRGPQGTLYGASTLGGVARVLTKDANLSDFEFKARTSLSATESGSESYRGDVAVNIPIIEGRLAARAVAGYQELGGWIDKPNERDANDSRIRNFRLKVGAQPTDKFSVGATMWLSRADRGAPPASRDGRINGSSADLSGFTDYDIFGLKLGYEFSGFAVTSMTSHFDYEHTNRADELLDGNLLFDHPTAEVFTQEVLLNSTSEGNWRWSLGGTYRDNSETYFVEQLPFVGNDGDISRSIAVFGEVTRQLLDKQVELTLGLRHFKDDLTTYEIARHFGATTPDLRRAKDSFDHVSPRVVLTWHPREQSTLYASYGEGFRSGRLQSAFIASNAPDFPPVDPDTLRNYELGAKGSLLSGKLGYEAALYYTDWQDIQLTRSVQPLLPLSTQFFAVPLNGQSASGVGIDFSLTATPTDRLDLGVNFSWNDLASDIDVLSRGIVLFAEGDRLNYSPEMTAGTFADYAFPLGSSGLEGRVSASANYTARQDFRNIQGGVRVNLHGDPMFLARTSFSVASRDRWTATLFADNVTNEMDALIGPVFGVVDAPTRVRPRTFGFQFEYRY